MYELLCINISGEKSKWQWNWVYNDKYSQISLNKWSPFKMIIKIPYKSYYLPRAPKEIPHCKNHIVARMQCVGRKPRFQIFWPRTSSFDVNSMKIKLVEIPINTRIVAFVNDITLFYSWLWPRWWISVPSAMPSKSESLQEGLESRSSGRMSGPCFIIISLGIRITYCKFRPCTTRALCHNWHGDIAGFQSV